MGHHKKKERIDPLTRALPLGGVDSHAHLDGPDFDADRDGMLARARQAGVSHVGNVFLGPEEYQTRRHVFDGHPGVFFLLGIHPMEGQRATPDTLQAMRTIIASEPRIRAIGEIGLDFYWKDCPREIQFQALADQLDLARATGLPVAIHCREAEPECFAFLEARGIAGYPLLWHCFGGDADMARRIMKNGWHISVPGPVTYKANAALREALSVIPADRLLMETDAPYLSPEPWRGTRNEPALTVFTIRAMAEARGVSAEELWQTCGDNARRFFGLAAA